MEFATPSKSEIHNAALRGDLTKVKALVKEKPGLASSLDNNGLTPLDCAAFNGRTDITKFLVSCNASINAKNAVGLSALHCASLAGQTAEVRLLVALGADVNIKNNGGETPLHLAAQLGQLNVAQTLIQDGAEIDARDNNDSTPLHAAAKSGASEVARLLLENHADMGAEDNKGNVPEYYAQEGTSGPTLDVMQEYRNRLEKRKMAFPTFVAEHYFLLLAGIASGLALVLIFAIHLFRRKPKETSPISTFDG